MESIKFSQKHIKTLPLDAWQEQSVNANDYFYKKFQENIKSSYIEVKPVFNKNGQYICRKNKTMWFEVDGKAFKCTGVLKNYEAFVYLMNIENHKPLNSKEQEAIEVLIKTKRCPKNLLKLYSFDKNHVKPWIKQMRRSTVEGYKLRQRILAFKKQNENI